MDETTLRKTVEDLLVDACGSSEALGDGVDLLETGLLDSFALISLLDGLEDSADPGGPQRVSHAGGDPATLPRCAVNQFYSLTVSILTPFFCIICYILMHSP